MEEVGEEGGSRLWSMLCANPALGRDFHPCHWMPMKDLGQDGIIVIYMLSHVQLFVTP